MGGSSGLHRHGVPPLRRSRHGHRSTALEGVDFPKLNEILGLDEKNLTAIAAVSLGYRSPKDGNAQRPKSRLTRDELFTSLD